MKKDKIKKKIKTILQFIFNPRFLICFGLGWIITNGWSYIFLALGMWFGINWMVAVATGYLAMLWFPFTPEKIITVIIAMWLLKVLFPNDKKTLGILKSMYDKIKLSQKEKKDRKEKAKRIKKTEKKEE